MVDSSRLVLHMFCALVRQYCSSRYGRLITVYYSFLQCVSMLVMQYSVRTSYHGLFFICLMRQYISTVVLGTDDSSRLVLHLFSALVHQYRSTRYGRLITACSSFVQCASILVPQYLVRTTHHSLFFICLVRQYISTVVLSTDESSRHVLHLFSALVHQNRSTRYGRLITACSSFVQCASTLLHQYLVRTTHHGLLFICLVRQYISTVILSTENS